MYKLYGTLLYYFLLLLFLMQSEVDHNSQQKLCSTATAQPSHRAKAKAVISVCHPMGNSQEMVTAS